MRAFPLLPLKVRQSSAPFDIVVTNGGRTIRLAIDMKPENLAVVRFRRSARQEAILATQRSGGFYFRASSDSYLWIADLKPSHAQRLAQQFADKLSRVGLDDSEWLRISSTRR